VLPYLPCTSTAKDVNKKGGGSLQAFRNTRCNLLELKDTQQCVSLPLSLPCDGRSALLSSRKHPHRQSNGSVVSAPCRLFTEGAGSAGFSR
jgi:hypothetical protein